MKKIVLLTFLVLTSISLHAQEELTWHTDLTKATEISLKENKPMFLFFTGSDWCGWCIRLQNEVKKDSQTSTNLSFFITSNGRVENKKAFPVVERLYIF